MAMARSGRLALTPSAAPPSAVPPASTRPVEHPLAEEIRLRPAIHLALQQLQPRHVALGRAVAIRLAQGRRDGRVVLAQALRPGPELGDVAARRPDEPGIEGHRVPLAHQAAELARQFAGELEGRAVLQEA